MPRPPRLLFANHYYHVLNRANRGTVVFHEPADFHAFIGLIRRAQQVVEIPIIAACLMPNHVHLVVCPRSPADLPTWTRWLFTTHVRHYHQKYGTIGRLWQVNLPQTSAEIEAIRACVNRQRPFGDPEWVKDKARDAGLDQSLIDVGRPRKRRSGPIC